MTPNLIALCGHPKSGKSTLAEELAAEFGYTILDDGVVLREIAVNQFGISPDDVLTQEGKAKLVDVAGTVMSIRQVLGKIGNGLENQFGPYIIPYLASLRMSPGKRYVMPSVRKTQGHYWKRLGAVVLEVRNPMAGPSGNDFDVFDDSVVDGYVRNDVAVDCHRGLLTVEFSRKTLLIEARRVIQEVLRAAA